MFDAMFDRLLNALKQHMGAMDAARGANRMGIVDSYDPATHTARVRTQPENVLTGALPVAILSVGTGAMAFAPMPGAQVMVLPVEADAEHGVVICGIHSDTFQPFQTASDPASSGTLTPLNAGEAAWANQAGHSIRMTADGFVVNGPLAVIGDFSATGNVKDGTGTLDQLRQHYNTHRHTGVQSGAATTGLTNAPDNSGSDPAAPDPFSA